MRFLASHTQVTPVVGYRAWRTVRDGDRTLLQSPIVDSAIWPPGMPMTGNPNNGNEGVHAFKERRTAGAYCWGVADAVFGTVALAGRIVEHKDGYRAQSACPVTIWANDAYIAQRIAQTYGCETRIRNTKKSAQTTALESSTVAKTQ